GGLSGFANALSNVDLSLIAKSITNAGTISSAGNLNLMGAGSNLLVQNSGGTLSAANNINISAPLAGSRNWLNVFGGRLLSSQLNLNAASGKLNVAVDQISGLVNATACGPNIGEF